MRRSGQSLRLDLQPNDMGQQNAVNGLHSCTKAPRAAERSKSIRRQQGYQARCFRSGRISPSHLQAEIAHKGLGLRRSVSNSEPGRHQPHQDEFGPQDGIQEKQPGIPTILHLGRSVTKGSAKTARRKPTTLAKASLSPAFLATIWVRLLVAMGPSPTKSPTRHHLNGVDPLVD